MDEHKPIMMMNDFTILADSADRAFSLVRDELGRFAEPLKSPEQGMHTYRLTPLSLWNAAAEGMEPEQVIRFLDEHDRFGLAPSARSYIHETMGRYGKLTLTEEDGQLALVADDWKLMEDICDIRTVKAYLRERTGPLQAAVNPAHRGHVKRELLRAGYPVVDLAGYQQGETLPLELRLTPNFQPREYQTAAADRLYKEGSSSGGSGVVVLPCGAGKTVVGLALMARLQCATLILTSSATSVHQWRRELLEKTNAEPDWIGEYTGMHKEVRPITITTYQMMTYRKSKDEELAHLGLFEGRDWGLIIYDEVHLLPAPVFRMTAGIQATRRLGLTATLVREDGREEDVFSLIGPKRYELRWRSLEREGWIASAACVELAVELSAADRQRYWAAPKKSRHRLAGENPAKLQAAARLVQKHADSQIIVIGQYLDQLRQASALLDAPLIAGSTSQSRRQQLYADFRAGRIRVLIVSKVANFAVDLPEASVAIQLSGSFGSRQEEAQRLGRILRPKRGQDRAWFYTLVTADSVEAEFARNRQLFLVEQGYEYKKERALS